MFVLYQIYFCRGWKYTKCLFYAKSVFVETDCNQMFVLYQIFFVEAELIPKVRFIPNRFCRGWIYIKSFFYTKGFSLSKCLFYTKSFLSKLTLCQIFVLYHSFFMWLNYTKCVFYTQRSFVEAEIQPNVCLKPNVFLSLLNLHQIVVLYQMLIRRG
jgi:hypothetical protein